MIQCFKFITETELIKSFDERVARTKYILEYKETEMSEALAPALKAALNITI